MWQMSSICSSLYAERARQHSSLALRQQISQIRMAALRYMVGILIVFCYPFVFRELAHRQQYIQSDSLSLILRECREGSSFIQGEDSVILLGRGRGLICVIEGGLYKLVSKSNIMRKTYKPSEFRRGKGEIGEQKEIEVRQDNSENLSMTKFWDKAEENKANRWLNHLHEKPLLELINEHVEPSQFTPLKPTELNCYERLKTLLASQNGGGRCNNETQVQNNNKLLKNVVIFETEINKLQQSYQSLDKGKKSALQSKNGKSYLCSKSTTSKHNSVFDKNSLSYTLNATLQEYAKRNTAPRHSTRHEHPKHDLIKKSIKEEISELKKQSFSRFISHKKEINERSYVELEEFYTTDLQKKIEEMVDRKILDFAHIKDQNSRFNTILLEKQLHIEHLIKELKLKEEKLANEIEKQEPHQQMITLRLTVQQFYDEFHHIFGNMSLVELKKKLDYMETMCLNHYASSQGQHLDMYSKLKCQNIELNNKLKERQKKYQEREQELNAIIRQRDKFDKLDNSAEKHEIFNKLPQFRQKLAELEKLQRFILNKYVEWLNSKSQAETKVIKLVSSPSSLQNYQEMIEDMLFFKQELTADKQTNYISKLLGAILKLKKIVAPSKLHQRLEPIKSLQDVEIYIKSLKNKRAITNKKTFKLKSQIVIDNLEEMGLQE